MAKATILLVEDDASLGFIVKDNLEVQGYHVRLCEDGETGLNIFNSSAFDLCILDVMLPKKDGFTLAADIRKNNSNVPILFLTAKTMKDDRIHGFKTGGDDYITKPFSIEELLLRIDVFLRRSMSHHGGKNTFKIGDFSFDHANLSLRFENSDTALTQKEADILKLFCEHSGNILKREEILLKIWGDDDYFIGRSLDVFISRIRKYLKADPKIDLQNLHGVGFRLLVNPD